MASASPARIIHPAPNSAMVLLENLDESNVARQTGYELSNTSGYRTGAHRMQDTRYEGFAIHNWTLNQRMTLESSLVCETSEIRQRRQVNQRRNFDYIRPSLDTCRALPSTAMYPGVTRLMAGAMKLISPPLRRHHH